MNCKDIQDLLSPYLDGVLEEKKENLVSEHLSSCVNCQKELEELKKTIASLKSLGEVEPEVDFIPNVIQQIQSERNKKKTTRPLQWFRKSPWVSIGAAAAVVLLVIGMGIWSELGLTPAREEARDLRLDAPDIGISEDARPFPDAAEPQMEKEMIPEHRAEFTEEGLVEDVAERKIIMKARFQLKVLAVDKVVPDLEEIAAASDGYIQTSRIEVDEARDLKRAYLVLRVPQEMFGDALDKIAALGRVTDRELSGQDVTEEYYDLETRIRVLKAEEESLLKILEQAETVEDILRVREELSKVREQIERWEGRLKQLTHLASMATIEVTLEQDTRPVEGISGAGMQGLGQKAMEGLIGSLNYLTHLVGNTVVLVFSSLPYLISVGLLGWIFYRLFRKFKPRFAGK